MSGYKAALLGTVVWCVSVPAFAETETHEVAAVVVTGTRSQSGIPLDQLGSSITVIDSEEMRNRQVRVVSDVLRDVPGVSVGRAGAVGNLTQVRIRGSEANHVLVLVDGVEVSDPFMGEFDFATILADDVARLEVLRGQQSAIYGSDAIAGVINYMIPSGAEAAGNRLRLEGGSFGTYGAAARIAGVREKLDYVLSAAMQYADGFATATHGNRHISSDLANAGLKLAYAAGDTLSVRGGLRWTHTKADSNGQDYASGLIVDTPGSYSTAQNQYAHLVISYAPQGARWGQQFTVQGVRAERDQYARSGRTGGGKGSRFKASYVADYERQIGELEHRLSLAADYEREHFRNTGPYSPHGADLTARSISNYGVVAQYDVVSDGGYGGGLAVRQDHNDHFRDATTYRLHSFWDVSSTVRLRAAAGTGIKNPGQTELFGYNASAYPFVGNPNLKPERSQGWEIGTDLDWQGGAYQLGLTYFNARLKDEIYGIYGADPQLCATAQDVPSSCQTTGNRDTVSRQSGIEVFGRAILDRNALLHGTYTYLDAKENGVQEIRRPRHIASANLTFHAPGQRGQATVTVRYNGKTKDTDFSAYPARTVTLDQFVLLNLSGSWRVNDTVELFARVENLLDQDYQEVLNYRGGGRGAYAGIRLQF